MNFGGVVHLNRSGICLICFALIILCVYMISNNNQTQNMKKVNLKNILQYAIKAAQNGGREVVEMKDNLNIKKKGLTKEGAEDRVTTADFLSHCSMLGTLKNKYPTINIVSEEAETKCSNNQIIDFSQTNDEIVNNLRDELVDEKDVTVWIDPLDATHEYTEKLYNFVTTMVCVAVKGKPVIGVIHKPFESSTTWAWVEKGMSPTLQTNKNTREETKKITISRTHSGKIRSVLGDKLKDYAIVIAAGAGYKALEVATGAVDAYMHITAIKKWDICAGNAIISALGGKLTTKFNHLIDYANLGNVENKDGLVATLKNHEKFLEMLL